MAKNDFLARQRQREQEVFDAGMRIGRQQELDGQLREVWGEELTEFYDRYPYVKKIDYSKPKKGWV